MKQAIYSLSKLGYKYISTNEGSHFIFKNDFCGVELHWSLINKKSPVQSKIYNPKIYIPSEQLEQIAPNLYVLPPYENIIYLALHNLKEGYASYKWFYDIYLLLQNINLQRLYRIAQKRKTLSILMCTFYFMQKIGFDMKNVHIDPITKLIIDLFDSIKFIRIRRNLLYLVLIFKRLIGIS